MKKIAFIALAAIACAFSGTAQAGNTAAQGYIGYPWANGSGSLMFNVDVAHAYPPACQSSAVPNRWEIDTRTATGQVQASLLMTAYSLHKRIFVIGSGGCAVWGDSETVWYFEVEN